MLIEAFAQLSGEFGDYSLTIWGEGPERANLEELIKELNMQDRIFLPGASDNVLEEIYDEGIFVLSSDFEGMPNALMEAMALGLPCISTDCPCGGPKDLIKNGENGILVPVGNVNHLATAMKELISDNKKAREMEKKAIEIRQYYDTNTTCSTWIAFFEKFVNI